jgi:hypothetical protein
VSEIQKRNPGFKIEVRYYIDRAVIPDKFRQRLAAWHLSFRKISNSTNARTLVVSITPQSGLLDSGNNIYIASATHAACLLGSLNSFAMDYVARQKMGGPNMTVGIMCQLPSLPVASYDEAKLWLGGSWHLRDWLLPRVLELTYTAWDLAPFAKECGWSGPPFRFDNERRYLLRCELDAAFFHLYLPAEKTGDWERGARETAEDLAILKGSFPTPRDAAAYIMDTFPIVRRADEAVHGEYRTKRVILNIYDAMQKSMLTCQPYTTRLDPPPADPQCCHPPEGT